MSMVRSFFGGEKNADNFGKVSIYLEMFSGHPDMIQVDRYLSKLKKGEFKGKNAFLKNEEPYKLIKKYFNEPFGSSKYESAVTDIYCFCGKLWRILNGKPYGIKEKLEAKVIQNSYLSGKEYLKAATWVAVHSYMSNSFLSMDGIDSLIPIGRPDLSGAWNRHLANIYDMEKFDMEIYNLFYIDSVGSCKFHDWYIGKITDPAEKEHPQDDVLETVVEPNNKMDSGKRINSGGDVKKTVDPINEPKQDQSEKKDSSPKSFTDILNGIVNIAKNNNFNSKEEIEAKEIPNDIKKNVDVVKDNDKKNPKPNALKEKGIELKSGKLIDVEVISPEKISTEDVESADKQEVKEDEQKEDRFQNLKGENGYTFGKLRQAFTSNDGTEDAAGKAPDVPDDDPNKNGSVQNGADEEQEDSTTENNAPVNDQYSDYNAQWEKAYPGLDKFTKIVHSTGYSVVYAAANNFPGLILTQIVDMSMNQGQGGVKKYLFIDPGFIYGDTMRIISTDRPDGNLYREVYLSRNNKKDIIKLITTGLIKEDRKRINESLPRSIFNVIDHVDMKECNISNFFSWKYLIINISNVLKNLPNCRMRLIEIEANNKFKLICDDKVISIYDNGIMDTDSHRDALENGLYVDYDPEKYGDKLYMVGYISGKDLEFDPYRIMPKRKEKEEKKENKEEVTKEEKKEDDANNK